MNLHVSDLKEGDVLLICDLDYITPTKHVCVIAPFPNLRYDGKLNIFRSEQYKDGRRMGYMWLHEILSNFEAYGGYQVIEAVKRCDDLKEAEEYLYRDQDEIPWDWIRRYDNRFISEYKDK